MTARFLVGDVHDRLTDIPDASVDLILTSPPFLALRSYLPDGHPDKAKEIGSEPTPAAFIDVLLQLTGEWGRVLAPHGSIAVELGDTYAGSGGAGGDYGPDGMRGDQSKFKGSALADRKNKVLREDGNRLQQGDGWPLAKSLACIPQLYQVALAYGRNPLRAPLSAREMLEYFDLVVADLDHDAAVGETPLLTASQLLTMMRQWLQQHTELGPTLEYERWRVRTLKPWIRSNPPVGALGDKERPATSYVIVACRAADRWFDLDAVRTPGIAYEHDRRYSGNGYSASKSGNPARADSGAERTESHPGGAPPRDWWHHVDAVLDTELAARRDKPTANRRNAQGTTARANSGKAASGGRGGNWSSLDVTDPDESTVGAQGVHLRRALERAGILTTLEALDVSPKGYAGAHYAVWPPELVRLLVDEMCPRRVCTVCGEPSRRITDTTYEAQGDPAKQNGEHKAQADYPGQQHQQNAQGMTHGRATKHTTTLGWSNCGHQTWRSGHVLDPFAGSGTTLAVAQGMGRTATGIDIDERNAWLAQERVGMFLEIDHGTREAAS